MDIRKKYTEETGKLYYKEATLEFEWDGDYVEWLEQNLVKLFAIPAVIHSLPEDATTCIKCGEFEPYCKCKDGYKRHFLAEQHEMLLAKNCYTSDVIKSVCGDCIYYLTCNNESRDKQICDNYDNES